MSIQWISPSRIEYLLQEDFTGIDITSDLLLSNAARARLQFYARTDGIVCCTEEAEALAHLRKVDVALTQASGTPITAQQPFFALEGNAQDVHSIWKVCMNLFEHYSALATKTHTMVQAIHAVNPNTNLYVTRKSIPGTRDLATKAIHAGGAFLHRLGLAETILIFEEHRVLMGGKQALLKQLPALKRQACEKKVFIECCAADAGDYLAAGADGIQLDKLPVTQATQIITTLRANFPHATLTLAGGINPSNCREYAASGADGLITSAPLYAPPLDMGVIMTPVSPC